MMKRLWGVHFTIIALAVLMSAKPVFAAETSLSLSPKDGSFGKEFNVDVVIDGHGDQFNAAEAIATVSAELVIKDLVLGDCGFSFITAPSTSNPSFAGILLGKKINKCTAYSLTLVPIQKGTGTFSFSKATVRKYGDASNVLKSVVNGSYTLTDVIKYTPSKEIEPAGSDYTVLLKILNESSQPAVKSIVTLTPAESENSMQATTDNTGSSRFEKVKAGVYVVGIEGQKDTKILNINGNNHLLNFSIKLKIQNKGKPLPIAGGIIALVGLLITGYVFIKKK